MRINNIQMLAVNKAAKFKGEETDAVYNDFSLMKTPETENLMNALDAQAMNNITLQGVNKDVLRKIKLNSMLALSLLGGTSSMTSCIYEPVEFPDSTQFANEIELDGLVNDSTTNDIPTLLEALGEIRANEDMKAFKRQQILNAAPQDATSYKTDAQVLFERGIKPINIEIDLFPEDEDIKLPEPLTSRSDLKTDYDWSVEAFDNAINEMLDAERYHGKFKNSVLRSQGKTYIEAAQQYGLDPRVLFGISMHESSRGTSKVALNSNNIGGMKSKNNKYIKFNTVDDSIYKLADVINNKYDKRLTNIEKIGYSGTYCEKSAAPNWIKEINQFIKTFDKIYSQE